MYGFVRFSFLSHSLFMHLYFLLFSSWSTWQASIEERGQRQNRTQSGTVYTDTVPGTLYQIQGGKPVHNQALTLLGHKDPAARIQLKHNEVVRLGIVLFIYTFIEYVEDQILNFDSSKCIPRRKRWGWRMELGRGISKQ